MYEQNIMDGIIAELEQALYDRDMAGYLAQADAEVASPLLGIYTVTIPASEGMAVVVTVSRAPGYYYRGAVELYSSYEAVGGKAYLYIPDSRRELTEDAAEEILIWAECREDD